MVPITYKEQIICKNCVWGTRESDHLAESGTVYCEVWNCYESAKSFCCDGQFPCNFRGQLEVLLFDRAMEELTNATKETITPMQELETRRKILSLLKRATAVSNVVAVERENYTSEALEMLMRLWDEK